MVRTHMGIYNKGPPSPISQIHSHRLRVAIPIDLTKELYNRVIIKTRHVFEKLMSLSSIPIRSA
jgi:hypothetical protein